MTILLTGHGEFSPPSLASDGERLWISPADFHAATGWVLKPEGLCKGEVCVPIPRGRAAEFGAGERIDAAAFWRYLDQPLHHSADGHTWVLGDGARARAAALRSLAAPDFALPDCEGRMHALAEHRGKKVFLVCWASW